MNRDQRIYEKVNQAVRLLCDVYDILAENIDVAHSQKLLTIKQFCEKHENFTQTQIRFYIFDDIDGFKEKVVRKVGKRIFINEPLFFEWINKKF